MDLASYPSLQAEVVFITGGASGLGAAFVESFHDQGSKVAFVDLQEDEGRKLADRLGGCWFRKCDVTDAEALQAAIRDAGEALGPVTVLVNNVAEDTRQPTAEVTLEQWRKGLAVNLDAAFIAAHAVYPMMAAAGGGAIINLSSINVILGPPLLATYVAAKGAINALTKALAHEWGPRNIRVNAISPGWVVTERQLQLWLTPDAEAEWMRHVALKRRILPGDVARAALFLASDDSQMITGQNIVVDGGRT
jgi:NAD(P)-dependent dehydrogenase (short-subunit alcohol dehydrogenase family)